MTEIARFEVAGSPCSANRVTRRVGNRSVKSAAARAYQALVREAALAYEGEPTREPCAVWIDATNVRLDVDNIAKSILDGMAGVVYANDRQVLTLSVRRAKDAKDKRQRVRVIVSEA
ncbi:MAG: hypothetical protein NVS2B17_29090 [Candidatus Velthaea sp.]